MTLRFGITLTADGKQAKAEMVSVGRSADDVRAAFDKVNTTGRRTEDTLDDVAREARDAATGLDAAGDQARQTAADYDAVAAAGDRAAQGARGIEETHTVAAGSVGNLYAQFNDIGVMMAAGQNPFQLAIQQGTQISQVLGPMGARGAVVALRSALVSMVNPVSLITIGSIAAGAAMVQWLTSAGAEAETLDDALERLAGRVDDYRGIVGQSAAELREEFGSISPEVARMLRDLQETGLDTLLADAEAAGRALRGEIEGGALNRAFGQNDRRIARTGRDAATDELNRALGAFAAAEGPEDQLAALERVQRTMVQISGSISEMTEAQRGFYDQTVAVERELRRTENASGAVLQGIRDLGADMGASIQDYVTGQVEAARAGQALLDQRAQEIEMTRAIAQYGGESAEVKALEAEAARETFKAQLEAEGIVGALLDYQMAQYDAQMATANEAQRLADIVASTSMGHLVDEAYAIAEGLGVAYSTALALARLGPQGIGGDTSDPNTGMQYGGRGGDPRDMGGSSYDRKNAEAIQWLENWEPPRISSRGGSGGRRGGGGRGGGGATSELERQREAVEKLIAREREELELLRETDPVQKEMIRNRETLEAATVAERREVETLIRTRREEEQAIATAKEQYDAFRDTTYDLITGVAEGGDAAAQAWDRAAASIAEFVWQAALLGEGPFAKFLGLEDGGGLLGMLFSAVAPQAAASAIPGNADGGMFYTEGDGRADKGLSWLASGEFIVNAHATARHRALLEAINSNAPIPALAEGGAFRAGPAPVAGGATVVLKDATGRGIDARYDGEEPLPGGGRAPSFILSDQVAASMGKRGGAARRLLEQSGARFPRARR